MGSKGRHEKKRFRKKDMHDGRGGYPKAGFSSRDGAQAYIEHLVTTVGAYEPLLRAYRCAFCPQWHIGHVPRSRLKM